MTCLLTCDNPLHPVTCVTWAKNDHSSKSELLPTTAAACQAGGSTASCSRANTEPGAARHSSDHSTPTRDGGHTPSARVGNEAKRPLSRSLLHTIPETSARTTQPEEVKGTRTGEDKDTALFTDGIQNPKQGTATINVPMGTSQDHWAQGQCTKIYCIFTDQPKKEREREALKKDTIYSSIQYWQMTRCSSARGLVRTLDIKGGTSAVRFKI